MIMPNELEIIDVGEMHPNPDTPCWYVTMRRPDKTLHMHIFPKATLEWRAAEYGLTDPAEILDVILHERHRPRAVPDDRVSLTGQDRRTAAAAPPVSLWTARSTAEAREAHRNAIAAVKATTRVVDPAGHLSHIVNGHGMDPARVRAKAELVDTQRWINLYGGLPVEPLTKEAARA
jgi:hypothetical protein